jgi:hypothetical protein
VSIVKRPELRNEEEKRAWIAFCSSMLTRTYPQVEEAALVADELVLEYRKRVGTLTPEEEQLFSSMAELEP